MMILEVVPFFTPSRGGSVTALWSHARELSKRGHSVTIVTTDFEFEEEYAQSLRNVGVIILKFHCSAKFRLFLYSPSLARWVKGNIERFDVVHLHNYRSYQNVVTSRQARIKGIPYILQAHGSLPNLVEKRVLKRFYDSIWGNEILKNATAVIALNHMEEEQCRSMGVKEDRIRIIPNGISASDFEHLPERGAFRAKYGIGSDWPVVLYLGRIHRIKGLDLLLAAFASLEEKLYNVRLVLAGPDDGFLLELESQMKALGIENRVIVTGPLYDRQKLEAYVAADVFVLPSQYEIFGITVLEAAACGTPVVVTRRCGISDFVAKVGYVVNYDSHELGEAIVAAINTKRSNKNMAYDLRKLVRQDFEWDNLVERLEEVYEQVVDQ